MPAEMSRTGPAAVVEDEVAAGRGHLQDRPGPQATVEVAAGDAVRLLLDADPVGAGVGRRGQRVAAYRGRCAGTGDPQRQVLAGLGGRELASILGAEVERGHGRALADHLASRADARKRAQRRPGGCGHRAGSGIQQVAE